MALAAVGRTIILYLLIIAGIRVMGKRQVGELEPSELVLDLIIADLAAVPMQDLNLPILTGVLPILTLLVVSLALSYCTMKSTRFRAIVCGRPSIVVHNGALNQKEMRRNRFTIDELHCELRQQGYTDIAAIKYAILETSGKLSVIPIASEKPATAGQFGTALVEQGLPIMLITDGLLKEENLRRLGYDRVWLNKRLEALGAQRVEDVFLLTVDESGGIYGVRKERKKFSRKK